MKLRKFTHPIKTTLAALGFLAAMVVTIPASAHTEPGEDKPAKKSKFKLKSFTSLNNNSVKIYPDIIKREMHVIAKENKGKQIDFFVFDLEGTLMKHFKMNEKDHYKISGLERGIYVYRIFSGDEETAAGDFQIR